MLSLLFAAASLFHPLTPAVPAPTGDGLPAKAPSAVGMSAARLATIDRVIERGIRAGGYPGAAVVVGRKGAAVWEKGFGRLGWTSDAGSVVAERTIYDLASLTKVVGTTTAVMILFDEGKLRLDDQVVKYIPEFTGGAKDQITIRMLLEHRSGLPAGRDLWRLTQTPEEARAAVISTPLFAAPGQYIEYSDLGADMLGFVVEAVSGQRLDQFLDERVFTPLGMTDTHFRPDASLRGRIAPTELTPPRGYPLRGEVHDENAYALGGVAGHAGLFSTASDLAVFAQMLLNGGSYNGTRIVADSTVKLFTRRAAGTRALGWDTCGGHGSCGKYLGANAYGHTGFTGTSLWIDPDREMFVVLLTNRVHAARAPAGQGDLGCARRPRRCGRPGGDGFAHWHPRDARLVPRRPRGGLEPSRALCSPEPSCQELCALQVEEVEGQQGQQGQVEPLHREREVVALRRVQGEREDVALEHQALREEVELEEVEESRLRRPPFASLDIDARDERASLVAAVARAGDTPNATHGAHAMSTDDRTNESPVRDADPSQPPADQGSAAPGSGAAFSELTLEQVKLALRKVKDPDLNLNIVDLGLVYDVRLVGTDVEVDMSLTSPGCPSGPEIMGDAERILKAVPGVGSVTINLVWTPFWSPDRIEPRVRAYMGL